MESSKPSWGHITGATRLPVSLKSSMSCFSCISPTLCPWAGHSAAIHALSVSAQFFPKMSSSLAALSKQKPLQKVWGHLAQLGWSPQTVFPGITERGRRQRGGRWRGRATTSKWSQTPRTDKQAVKSLTLSPGDFISWLMVDLRLLGRI